MTSHPTTPQGIADRGEGLAGFLDLQVGHDQFTTEELIELCGALVKDPQVQPDWSLMFKDFETRFRGLSAELERLRGELNVEHEAAEISSEELARLREIRGDFEDFYDASYDEYRSRRARFGRDHAKAWLKGRVATIKPQPQEASEGQ